MWRRGRGRVNNKKKWSIIQAGGLGSTHLLRRQRWRLNSDTHLNLICKLFLLSLPLPTANYYSQKGRHHLSARGLGRYGLKCTFRTRKKRRQGPKQYTGTSFGKLFILIALQSVTLQASPPYGLHIAEMLRIAEILHSFTSLRLCCLCFIIFYSFPKTIQVRFRQRKDEKLIFVPLFGLISSLLLPRLRRVPK